LQNDPRSIELQRGEVFIANEDIEAHTVRLLTCLPDHKR